MKKISKILFVIVIIISTTCINYLIYNNYYNNKIINIANNIVENHKEVKPSELAETLKDSKNTNYNVLKDYGYNENDLFLNEDIKNKIVLNIVINLFVIATILTIYNLINNKKRKSNFKEINDLITLLEKINAGNYNIELDKFSETSFSKLRNEIYKTTGLLKEQTEFLNTEKNNLKNNLADISHQIRTPMTSINLMLETIIEDKNMSKEKQLEFLNIIYKQTEKVVYLVENLLKLSKFDASVIELKKEKVYVYKLLNNVADSLKYLSDGKNLKININANENITINCDKGWQEEAITNVVKNSIEYSKENSNLDILVTDNNFYTMITIKDYGSGISKEDLKKVFIRFHKSKNSNGVGIGLNLAKTIIEKDNGLIEVTSKENEYTIFTIKYLK